MQLFTANKATERKNRPIWEVSLFYLKSFECLSATSSRLRWLMRAPSAYSPSADVQMLPVLSDCPSVQWWSPVYCSGYTVVTPNPICVTTLTEACSACIHTQRPSKDWVFAIRTKPPETTLTAKNISRRGDLNALDSELLSCLSGSYCRFTLTLLYVWSCCVSLLFSGESQDYQLTLHWAMIQLFLLV